MKQYGGMRRLLALTLCCTVVLGGVGRAQEDSGRLVTPRGTVIDNSQRPVAGVLVYLSSARVFNLSDDAGMFTLAEIEPGVDTLQVRAPGFGPRSFQLAVSESARDTTDIGNIVVYPGPPPTLALTGTVRDTLQDRPVVGAEVMVNETVVAKTDMAGAYSATDIPVDWGMNTVLVRCVGYAPLLYTLWVEQPSTRRSVHSAMRPHAVELPAVVVEADRITFVFGRMREFWRRREMGLGWFFTRDEIEKRNPLLISDLLRTIPGVSVHHTGFTTQVRFRRFGMACPPGIWIDGVLQADPDVDALVWPEVVEAIEVYRGSAQAPVQFRGAFHTCGVIVIWTR